MSAPAHRSRRRAWGPALALALLVHAIVLPLLSISAALLPAPKMHGNSMSLVILQPPPQAEEPDPEPEPEPELSGQIVDVAPPLEEERPEEARFLAEHDQVVEEETRSERFLVNPEVLAPVFSKEASVRAEDIEDVNVEEDSTGATVGNDRFDPATDGRLAALPSEWTRTNREGIQAPRMASHTESQLAGAPSNDRLDVKVGLATQLNTKEFLYAAYLNQIRRIVSFYWDQNLSNLPPNVRLYKSEYTTAVHAVLTREGALSAIVVAEGSGIQELDAAVTLAFALAVPLPPPPEGMLDSDGLARLPPMSFTVRVGRAENPYRGVDPRAGVQFPGLLKAPR